MTIPIPSDEALNAAYYGDRPCSIKDGLRAVATLAANQAAEQAVKEAVLRIDKWAQAECGYYEDQGGRAMLRRDFPSAFRPTPPKEQQPVQTVDRQGSSFRDTMIDDERTVEILRSVTPVPSPDPATVRLDEHTIRVCMSHLAKQVPPDDGNIDACILSLESLLPKPTPAPEPERYVTTAVAMQAIRDVRAGECPTVYPVFTIAEIAARHGLLTPEQALEAWREVGDTASASRRGYGETEMLAGFRLAAKQGGAA